MSAIAPFLHEHVFAEVGTGDGIVDQALQERERVMALVKQAVLCLKELNTIKTEFNLALQRDTFILMAGDVLKCVERTMSSHPDIYVEKIQHLIDAHFWHNIVESSRLTTVMNAKMKKDFRTQIERSPPSFTRDVVYPSLDSCLKNRMATFIEGAIEIFKGLSPGFKSNDGILFRSRIIFPKALYPTGWNNYFKYDDSVNDLERIFLLLDGKDPTDFRGLNAASHRIANAKMEDEDDDFQLPYFSCRMYKNGSVHLYFTHEALLSKLNNLLAAYYGESLGQRQAKR